MKNTQFETSGDAFWSLKCYLQVEHKAILAIVAPIEWINEKNFTSKRREIGQLEI